MATYYVRTDGNDANTGLGSSAAQAWQTLSKALGATGIGSGDTLYIAPGTYRQGSAIVVGGTYSAMTYVYGDPTGAQFSGVPAGLVRITTFTPTDTSASSAVNAISVTSKSNLTFANLLIETGTGSGIVFLTACNNIVVQDCVFTMQRGSAGQAGFSYAGGAVTTGITVQRCQFFGGHTSIVFQSSASALQDFKCFAYDNICEAYSTIGVCVGNPASTGSIVRGLGTVVANNIMIGGTNGFITGSGDDGGVTVRNNAVINATTGYASGVSYALGITASNNLALQCGANFTSFTNTGGRTAGVYGFDIGEQFKFGLATLMRYTNWLASPNIAAGSSSNAPATDQYNVTWYSTTPDIGAVTYRNVQTILPTYAPTERNASTITIAPGSTSQSIELYLGATGLAFNTSGLSAYYIRNRSAPVAITLVTQTATGAWTSGGFAEISSSLTPGVYRLDVPDAAFAAGATDVTLVVRGAAGTNGAVVTITLSAGGLSSVETANAVWNATASSYNTSGSMGEAGQRITGYSLAPSQTFSTTGSVGSVTGAVNSVTSPVTVGTNNDKTNYSLSSAGNTSAAAAVWNSATSTYTANGTFGLNVLRADQQNKQGLVTLHSSGNVNRVDSDVHAIANDADAATELKGALLHNGTDYIDSNLLSGNSTRVFVGRFQLTQTGTTQGDIIEAFTTDTPSFELQLFDGDNNIVPVTGATLGLRILDVTSTVVETGTPTIEYGTGGIVRWTAPGSYVSIGCPAGMYRLFVDRTVSGTTTTFGPLQIKVQVQ